MATTHDSMFPRSLWDVGEALPEMGVEKHFDGVLGKTFPAVPHYTFGPAWSVRLPLPPPDPTPHQLVSRQSTGSALLFNRVSSTHGHRSDATTTGRPGAKRTCGASYGSAWCRLWTNCDWQRNPITGHHSGLRPDEPLQTLVLASRSNHHDIRKTKASHS